MTDKEMKRTIDAINELNLMAHSLTQYAQMLTDMMDDGIADEDTVKAIQSHLYTDTGNIDSTIEALLKEIRGPYYYTNDPREDY